MKLCRHSSCALQQNHEGACVDRNGRALELPRVVGDDRTPYPWCRGAPTREDCIKAGYCRKDPSCGE